MFGRGMGRNAGGGNRGFGSSGGRGRGKCGQGYGPEGSCVCSKCGYTTAHQPGIPCIEIKCPHCNIPLTRKN